MHSIGSQGQYGVRFEWGRAGARAVSAGCDVAVVVDVLSFTTTSSVALDAGIVVLPYPFGGEAAATYAAEADATLAVGRSVAQGDQISLSSPTIRNRAQHPERLVLPSPNGSTISYELAKSATTVFGASLRNADAVASYICETYSSDATIAVVAAGEKWPDGSLRPAIEDLWGAGAILAGLAEHGLDTGNYSPESDGARSAWLAVREDISTLLDTCASGRELIDAGFPHDVSIAAEVDASGVVPVLRSDRFVNARM